MIFPFALVLVLVAQAAAAAAAPLPKVPMDAGITATFAAEQVAHAAQQLRGDATIAAALTAVKVGTDAAEQVLATYGFVTALDLQLLAGGPEAAELMAALSTGGELSIADRAKIRLLVGDQTHLAGVVMMPIPSEDVAPDRDQSEQAAARQHRQLQDGGADRGTLSADTIAIVFSVCVGVCGYLLQAWTSHRASQHAGKLQREHDEQARALAIEQDRTQAQIQRTERWVDDCCMPVSRALGEYVNARTRFGKCHRKYGGVVAHIYFLKLESVLACVQSSLLRRSWRRLSRRRSLSCTTRSTRSST